MAPYEIISIYLKGQKSDDLVKLIHQILIKQGGDLNFSCLLFLNDIGDEEFEPEEVINSQESLEKISSWPSYGTITYDMPEGEVSVTFDGENKQIFSVTISVPNSILEKEDIFGKREDDSWKRYVSIATQIHESTAANRTIFDWGLIENGFKWTEELEKLKSGKISEKYKYLDLIARNEYLVRSLPS
ncbi:MAG: hypothetical protein F6K47_34660 [Symploca sp. SIO2E6]|nr:hypothetical protein [Symploca sp. SIO2E6]